MKIRKNIQSIYQEKKKKKRKHCEEKRVNLLLIGEKAQKAQIKKSLWSYQRL